MSTIYCLCKIHFHKLLYHHFSYFSTQFIINPFPCAYIQGFEGICRWNLEIGFSEGDLWCKKAGGFILRSKNSPINGLKQLERGQNESSCFFTLINLSPLKKQSPNSIYKSATILLKVNAWIMHDYLYVSVIIPPMHTANVQGFEQIDI